MRGEIFPGRSLDPTRGHGFELRESILGTDRMSPQLERTEPVAEIHRRVETELHAEARTTPHPIELLLSDAVLAHVEQHASELLQSVRQLLVRDRELEIEEAAVGVGVEAGADLVDD